MLRSMDEMKSYTVMSADNDIVGQVHDFYFDDMVWAARYMVVDLGTWLPGRKVLISSVAFDQPDWGGGVSFPVKLSQEQIENSPSIDTDQPVSRQAEEELIRYYDWPAYWHDVTFYEAGAVGMTPEDYLHSQRKAAEAEAAHQPTAVAEATTSPNLRSISEVIGYHIEAADGNLGHVEDLIVDTESWTIRYLVIDTSNWWFGKKVLISPMWVDHIVWEENRVYVELNRDAIQSAPEYNPYDPINRVYENRLFDYYGRPYYW
ncbi:MAG: PRC-barrel domain-containing protein [Anaerolineae bacterium]|nr:PRC-barrel domain-containing protein [Anaerolineae bacterium]